MTSVLEEDGSSGMRARNHDRRSERAVSWQAREPASWFSSLFFLGLVGPVLCIAIGSQCPSLLRDWELYWEAQCRKEIDAKNT